ncbi:cobalamin biosynthesis protein CobY [Natrarchaeobius halalkaliphilus]|uniref:Cobalamin biosynthesis protein CobY n=1 Tax=Natrarchaeobius halalkaliphilus TaxID=1679091 RepID=A0A3N6LN42_9EURY|nr:NTP transferase domain-containing protein [Natrarchaeobius halalkaliphilus]RQG86995.1 cobalamin biosynthesis protein CobY [Natrarchaeobius halalkaliphilus]
MCGGSGTRLESQREKPLHPIGGVPMVDRVATALEASRIETIYAAVSPNAPETRAHLERSSRLETIETDGDGYVPDLLSVLDGGELRTPVLTVAADLPLLEAAAVDRVLATHGDVNRSRTVCVPAALKRRLGASVESRLDSNDHLAPTGLNVVGTTDETEDMIDVRYTYRLAVNVNRLQDSRLAKALVDRSESVDRGRID